MDNQNLDTAMTLFSYLIAGEDIGADHHRELYDAWQNNSEVCDILLSALKSSNLKLYEYQEHLYVTAGEGNRIFGFTNEELKRVIGLRLNRELYLAYLIMYNVLMTFYEDSFEPKDVAYIRVEETVSSTDSLMLRILSPDQMHVMTELQEDSFKILSAHWQDLPLVPVGEEMVSLKAARGSKTGFVRLVFNFMENQDLLYQTEGRYYITPRFKAMAENYFDENRSTLYQLLSGGADHAAH